MYEYDYMVQCYFFSCLPQCEYGIIYSRSGSSSEFFRVPDLDTNPGNRKCNQPTVKTLKEHSSSTVFSVQLKQKRSFKFWLFIYLDLRYVLIWISSGSKTNNSGSGSRKKFQIQPDPDSQTVLNCARLELIFLKQIKTAPFLRIHIWQQLSPPHLSASRPDNKKWFSHMRLIHICA